jgi:hypothetical protein
MKIKDHKAVTNRNTRRPGRQAKEWCCQYMEASGHFREGKTSVPPPSWKVTRNGILVTRASLTAVAARVEWWKGRSFL